MMTHSWIWWALFTFRVYHDLRRSEDWTTWSNELAVLRSSSALQIYYWVFNLIFILTIYVSLWLYQVGHHHHYNDHRLTRCTPCWSPTCARRSRWSARIGRRRSWSNTWMRCVSTTLPMAQPTHGLTIDTITGENAWCDETLFQVYLKLQDEHNIPAADFPDVDVMREKLKK